MFIVKSLFLNLSDSHATQIPWVLPMCRIVGFLPVHMIWAPVSLSSKNFADSDFGGLLFSISQRLRAGMPSLRMETSAATISASEVLCDTHVCFLERAEIGKKELGPIRQVKDPVVDLYVDFSPAQSASLKTHSSRS